MYKQFELMYNNSVNLICECELIYTHNKKENTINQTINTEYMKPFKAKGGMTLFKNSFNPLKRTIFGVEKNNQDIYNEDKLGVEKNNQDIYNEDKLAKLISKTVITRTFKDIVGADKYAFKNTVIEQSAEENYIHMSNRATLCKHARFCTKIRLCKT